MPQARRTGSLLLRVCAGQNFSLRNTIAGRTLPGILLKPQYTNKNTKPNTTTMQQKIKLSETVVTVAGLVAVHVSPEHHTYFVSAADFIERETVRQLGEAFPEIIRVAEKTSANGEKPKTATFSATVHFDLSNPDGLNVKIKSSVAPWKLVQESEAVEDLRQLTLDLEHSKMTRAEAPAEEPPAEQQQLPAPGAAGTTTGDEALENLDLKERPELAEIAKKHGIKVAKKDTAESLREKLQAYIAEQQGK